MPTRRDEPPRGVSRNPRPARVKGGRGRSASGRGRGHQASRPDRVRARGWLLTHALRPGRRDEGPRRGGRRMRRGFRREAARPRTTSKGRARRGQGPHRPAAGPPCPDRRRDRDRRLSTLPPMKLIGFSYQKSMIKHGISDTISPGVLRLRPTGGDGPVRAVSRRLGQVQGRATRSSWPRPSLSCG
jgi:hypothetical protein